MNECVGDLEIGRYREGGGGSERVNECVSD